MVKFIFCILLAMSILVSCGKTDSPEGSEVVENTVDNEESEQENQAESGGISSDEPVENEDSSASQPSSGDEENEGQSFSFSDIKDFEFYFSSGVGAWSTEFTVNDDGSFSGGYHDTNMGETGEGFPNGTVYTCTFSGSFSQPDKINDYTYSVSLESLTWEIEEGHEEIIDGVKYIYSTPYGLYPGKEFYFYLPTAPFDQLPEDFISWANNYAYSSPDERPAELGYYGLYNLDEKVGFSGYPSPNADPQVRIDFIVRQTELRSDVLDKKLDECTTQGDMNSVSYEIYTLWDDCLNQIWNIFKENLDPDEMDKLTEEELSWIEEKEQAVTDASSEFEGGSLAPLAANSKAAELTRERVYYLGEYMK